MFSQLKIIKNSAGANNAAQVDAKTASRFFGAAGLKR